MKHTENQYEKQIDRAIEDFMDQQTSGVLSGLSMAARFTESRIAIIEGRIQLAEEEGQNPDWLDGAREELAGLRFNLGFIEVRSTLDLEQIGRAHSFADRARQQGITIAEAIARTEDRNSPTVVGKGELAYSSMGNDWSNDPNDPRSNASGEVRQDRWDATADDLALVEAALQQAAEQRQRELEERAEQAIADLDLSAGREDHEGPPESDPDKEGPRPIILDLDGNGISVTELAQSPHFVDGGDGLKHRTAWASAGDGELFYDISGDGEITEKREYAFTEWDPSATSDLEALRSVFEKYGKGGNRGRSTVPSLVTSHAL